MGTGMVPADMYSVLAAELMIWSIACISRTGTHKLGD